MKKRKAYRLKPDHAAEKIRRRGRTERGQGPVQLTSREENLSRRVKRPGRGNRASEQRRAIAAHI
jgi:hypothetical protein